MECIQWSPMLLKSCNAICDFSSQTFIFLIILVICNFWINLIAISKVIQIRVYKCFSLLARYSRGNSLLAILFYSFWVHILPGPHFFCRGTTGSNPFWWSKSIRYWRKAQILKYPGNHMKHMEIGMLFQKGFKLIVRTKMSCAIRRIVGTYIITSSVWNIPIPWMYFKRVSGSLCSLIGGPLKDAICALLVIEFQVEGYKFRNIFAQNA